MSDITETVQEVADGMEDAMNTILPGSEPLEGMEAFHEGGLEYQVISVRDGKPSIHWIELGETPTCTCTDYRANRAQTFSDTLEDNEREPCAHIVKAVLADQLDPETLAVRELVNVTATITDASAEARQAANEARETARELDTGLARVRDAQAGQAAETSSETATETASNQSEQQSQDEHSNDVSAAEACDKLQDAFDNVIDGMAVEYAEGVVWVNKTPQAPETLPGPGNVEIFSSFLQNPDQIQYVHENHDYAGAEPGQYFSNMIRPEDVDEYIEEVLE